MEFGRDEIELYCNDVLNSSLALIESALYTNKIELVASNQEQFTNLQITLDDIFNNFTYYYYAYGNNYAEHPCFGQYIDECEEHEAPPYLPEYYRNNAKSYYVSLIESGEAIIKDNNLFKIEYRKQSDTDIQFSFSINDKEKVRQALNEYLYKYRYDDVYNEHENVFDYETQRKQFYELLTKDDYNLNNFHVDDIKYIKALLEVEHEGKLIIQNTYISFNNNELACKCIISDNGFVFDYDNEKNIVVNNIEAKSNNTDTGNANLKELKRLTETDIHIISIKYHIEETTGRKATYKKIAEFMTKNGIYVMTENNVKQRVNMSIYTTLCVNDLSQAVYILKEHNMLKSYND